MRSYTILLLGLALSVNGIQLPFNIRFFDSQSVLEAPSVPRVAIVGAGAGGSSAAFWISKAKERFGIHVEVDVYEKSSYIGGRSTVVYPYDDPTNYEAVEIGASIFVDANKNLWRASDEFNLTRRNFSEEKEDYEIGVWDGENILLTVGSGWWDMAKVLWRYGVWSPKQTDSLVKAMLEKYLKLYSSQSPRWEDIADLSQSLGMSNLTSQTMLEYLVSNGVSEKYATELVEAATRVNYGQNVDTIHALEGACSMAADKATAIKGGNYQLFEKFLEHSNATVHLNTTVESILPFAESSKYWNVKTSSGQTTVYTAVILAAPFQYSSITLPQSIAASIPEQPYVHLHVTLLTTTSPTANPEYFGLAPDSKPARMMLTTNNGVRAGNANAPEFNSLSYHGPARDGEWVVKIFSKQAVKDDDLKKIFGETVGWVHRREFDAYPELPPTTTFPPVRLEKGLFYVNSFEPFISTMETETISSRNIVDLFLNEEFEGLSLCGGHTLSGSPDSSDKTLRETMRGLEKKKDFVYGWDC